MKLLNTCKVKGYLKIGGPYKGRCLARKLTYPDDDSEKVSPWSPMTKLHI